MSNTLTDTSKSWTPGEWIGGTVVITGGTGAGQVRGVTANTATELTVDAEWDVEPSGFTYKITLSMLTGIIRGAGGTEITPHPPGSLVLEVGEIGYTFIVAGHRCQAVRNVKVDDVVQAGGYSIELANTALIPGRTLTVLTVPPPSQGGPVSTGGGGGSGLRTASFAGTVTPRRVDAVLPSWLSGFVSWRADIRLAVLIDTGVAVADGQASVQVLISGNGLGTSIAAHVDEAAGQPTAVAASTSFLAGGSGGTGIWTYTLNENGSLGSAALVPYTNAGVINMLGPGGGISFDQPVGSCYFTGLVIDVDFLPEHVNEAALPGDTISGVVVSEGTPTAEAAATLNLLNRMTVTCDADGYEDDGAGTITGTPLALIESPGDVDRHLLGIVLGAGLGIFDTTSYAYARTRHATLGYRLNVVINTPLDLAGFLSELGRQSRCWVYSDGAKLFRVFLDGNPTPVFHVQPRHVIEDYPTWGLSSREAIITKLNMGYSVRWASDIYQRFITVTLTAPYDVQVETMLMNFIPLVEPMAQDVFSYLLGFFSRPRRTVTVKLLWNAVPLQVGDVIAFAFDDSLTGALPTWDDGVHTWDDPAVRYDDILTLDPQIMYNMWGQLRFRVHRVETEYESNTVTIEAIEA